MQSLCNLGFLYGREYDRLMTVASPSVDVLVLGEHPSAYLAAALLGRKNRLSVIHSTIPRQSPDNRLGLINPALFKLHPLLNNMQQRLPLCATYGTQFLADDPGVESQPHAEDAAVYIAAFADVREAMMQLARQEKSLQFLTPASLQVLRVDENGPEFLLDGQSVHPRLLVLAGTLPSAQQKTLGIPDAWDPQTLHRYTYVDLPGPLCHEMGPRPVILMSLDLRGELLWGWLLTGTNRAQLAVQQPLATVAQNPPVRLLEHWLGVLKSHGKVRTDQPLASPTSLDLPLGGALLQEGVANRTVLIGPAGGFYSASAEDVYPGCWSAVYAADVVKKALHETHVQDALQPYRYRWRTTLGNYLRGLQQNLRYLLPLVYRNPAMAERLSEAILLGKSVVR